MDDTVFRTYLFDQRFEDKEIEAQVIFIANLEEHQILIMKEE